MTATPTALYALFPGQGAQHVGMGKDLYTQFKAAREVFEEASDAISVDLKKLCFEGPESDLQLTENTQPCLLTASVASFRVARTELGLKPIAGAGHSLGEYSALVSAGALPLAAAARWVRARGRAMQEAVPAGQGGMAAILGLSEPQVTELCIKATAAAKSKRASGETADVTVTPTVEPANFNSPGQVVIAGSADGIREAVALVKAGGEFTGGKAMPLAVSAPFHCSLMRPARDRMAQLFSSAPATDQPKRPEFPYVPNRTARITSEAQVIFELLVEQVDHPVLWQQCFGTLLAQNDAAIGVEFGPGKVLQGLAKRIAQPLGKQAPVTSVGDSASLKNLEQLLKGGSPS